MNYFIQRLENAGAKILDQWEGDGIAAVLMQSTTGTLRIIDYDLDEAQHEGAECVVGIRAWGPENELEARAAFAQYAPKVDITHIRSCDNCGNDLTDPGEILCERCKRPRMFGGMYPCGIVYADRLIEVNGDYKRVAFLPYDTLKLEITDPKSPILEQVKADAARFVAGQRLQIAGNCTITLGGSIK